MINSSFWLLTATLGVVLLLMYLSEMLQKGDSNRVQKAFRVVLCWAVFFCLQDAFLSLCLDHVIVNNQVFFLASSIYHISAVGSSLFFLIFILRYVHASDRTSSALIALTLLALIVEIGLVMANVFHPLLFWIVDGKYIPGPMRIFSFFNQYIVYVILGTVCHVKGTRAKHRGNMVRSRRYHTAFYASLAVTFLGAPQFFYPEVPFYSLGYFLTCFIMHLFVVTKEREDALEARRQLEVMDELRKAKDEAEAANNAKTSFLFSMSHDIRTPMNAIIGFTELLRKHQDDPEKREDYLNKIQSSSKVLLSIIDNVLEMSRIESGRMKLDEKVWYAPDICAGFEDVIQGMLRKKFIHYSHDFNARQPYIYADAQKMSTILINLLSNAFKYTPEGGHVRFILEEQEGDKPGWIVYHSQIIDDGIGMSKEFLPHIFEEFARESDTTKAKIEGTGLGMPIVKRMVDMLGGTIKIESKKGVGTTVTLDIPHRVAEPEMIEEKKEKDVSIERLKGKRLLLAEDNELNAEIAMEILTEAGFFVDHAEDGDVCLEMLEKAPDDYYAAILMDIQMPRLDGYETTAHIRMNDNLKKASIPIIALTANAFEEDKQNAINAGMNGHVAKPIDIPDLLQELLEVVKD